jgi:hypothetical protein
MTSTYCDMSVIITPPNSMMIGFYADNYALKGEGRKNTHKSPGRKTSLAQRDLQFLKGFVKH